MSGEQEFFSDSKVYDLTMGRVSRVAGEKFLDWLSLPSDLRWLDVGCGTGSFTELILDQNRPRAVSAIDPSAEQIAFAKSKPSASVVDYRQGDAMALPFGDDEFDVAVMALVVQYIPDPTKAMSEMTRCVREGGTIAAYVWPGRTEGHPNQPVYEAARSIGGSGGARPGSEARTIEALIELLRAAGAQDIDSRSIEIRLEFCDFDDYWSAQNPDFLKDLAGAEMGRLKAALKMSLPTDTEGRIVQPARANAVRGCVSK